MDTLSTLWEALAGARCRTALFRIAVSFDRFVPSDEAQLELPFEKADERCRGCTMARTLARGA